MKTEYKNYRTVKDIRRIKFNIRNWMTKGDAANKGKTE